jgi:alpha-galactosidase
MTQPTIAFVGAGSTVFAKNLLGDILSSPALAGSDIRLFDIDPARLDLSEVVARRVADAVGATPTITATVERARALDGADYVLSMVQVAGYRPGTVRDFEIPKRYGLEQTIGDTLGIGGIMRGLRTIPVMRGVVRDMERLCPHALHLNYVNPMAMVTWALNTASPIPTVGLCHSVQGTASELAHDLGVPPEELDYLAAGINHMAFYLRLEHDGVDQYPGLEARRRGGPRPRLEPRALRPARRFGYFVTESSEHLAEYVPWYIKRAHPELLERSTSRSTSTSAAASSRRPPGPSPRRSCATPAANGARTSRPPSRRPGSARCRGRSSTRSRASIGCTRYERSVEYGATIIEAIETRTPAVVYGNVPNDGLIDGLPDGCCVEVPCLVDANGVQPVRVGPCPPS